MAPSRDAPNPENLDELFFLLNSTGSIASNTTTYTTNDVQGPATLPPVAASSTPRGQATTTNQIIQPVDFLGTMDKEWVQPYQSCSPRVASGNSSPSKDQEQDSRSTIQRENDVLLGRGKAYYRHPGNVRFRKIISDLSPSYEATGVNGKYIIRENIVQQIHRLGGRFLKHAGADWEIASDKEAMDKVAHGFRALRGKGEGGSEKRSSLQRKTSQSSTSSSMAMEGDNEFQFDEFASVARRSHEDEDNHNDSSNKS